MQIDMITLNSPKNKNNPEAVIEKETKDVAEIETRLNNCQYLELLYLIKHEELMKTFAFTLNLFDKYKYAIKILLFVLKNLVQKDTQSPVKVKLPKPLIPNILKLLQDQKQVQDVITTMQQTLDENSLKYNDIDATSGIGTTKAGLDEDKEVMTKLSKLSKDESADTTPIAPAENVLNRSAEQNTSPTDGFMLP